MRFALSALLVVIGACDSRRAGIDEKPANGGSTAHVGAADTNGGSMAGDNGGSMAHVGASDVNRGSMAHVDATNGGSMAGDNGGSMAHKGAGDTNGGSMAGDNGGSMAHVGVSGANSGSMAHVGAADTNGGSMAGGKGGSMAHVGVSGDNGGSMAHVGAGDTNGGSMAGDNGGSMAHVGASDTNGGSMAHVGASAVNRGSMAHVDASDLIAKFECARCHEIPAIEPAHRDKHCVQCHQQIHAGTFAAKPIHIARWKKRITSVRWVPSLASADRLRRSWVQAFLLAPHDVRPGLVVEMPRLAMTPEEAARLAAHLVPEEAGAPDVAHSTATRLPDAAPNTARSSDARDTARSPDAASDTARSSDARDIARSSDARDTARSSDARDTARSSVANADIARGKQLFRSLACARCHRFTGSAVDDAELHANGRTQVGPLDGAWALAPDLRFARQRMTIASMSAWIVAPRGAMPALGVSADTAAALAAFIAQTQITDEKPRMVPTRLPVLARAVRWPEVEKRVFRNVCWHCHAVPDFARGDGGPGNSGGFGFAPRGLDLSSYEGIASGSLDEHGERRSVFAKIDGTPRIVAHLMARYVEEAGGTPSVRGMPLGMPPLPLEEIQLVESWIAQGRPR